MSQAELVLRTDCRHGLMCDEMRVGFPTEADLMQAIEALDAEIRTALTPDRVDASTSVGGGRGRHVIFVTVGDDKEIWNLNGRSGVASESTRGVRARASA